MTSSEALISAGAELDAFRDSLTPELARRLLAESGGRVAVTLPVGVGKTAWLCSTAADAIDSGAYRFVAIAAPQHRILAEIREKLARFDPLLLEPRPRRRCGPRDATWSTYEKNGLGMLGRETLCRNCPFWTRRRGRCRWPRQIDRARSARIVLLPQQRIAKDSSLLRRLAGRRTALFLIDEADVLTGPLSAEVTTEDLDRFLAVLGRLSDSHPALGDLRRRCEAFRAATTADLRAGWSFPRPPAPAQLALQRAGVEAFGGMFYDLTHDLRRFGRSDRLSRVRTGGGVRFASPPDLPGDAVVYAAGVSPRLVRYRLDPDHAGRTVAAPFENHLFGHPDTEWLHVNGFEGCAKFVPHNRGRIVELAAGLIRRNVEAGRKTLLVARKRFVFDDTFAGPIEDRLRDLGVSGVRVVTGDWSKSLDDDPTTVPLISYGVRGTNLFEDFDCCVCLSSYLVNGHALARRVLEFDPDVPESAVRVATDPVTRRRRCVIDHPSALFSALPGLGDDLLAMLEADVVLQAVGRVRPFTRPRLVVTLQPGPLPYASRLPGYREVRGLGEARALFELPTRKARERDDRAALARVHHAAGRTKSEIAALLGVTPRSVANYLRPDRA